jgi:hypothetical protein
MHTSTSVGVVHDMGVFPSMLLGTALPFYTLAVAARRETVICLRNFGQIARCRRTPSLNRQRIHRRKGQSMVVVR